MYTDDNEYDVKEEKIEKRSSSSSSKGTVILCIFLAIVLAALVFFAFFKKDDGDEDDFDDEDDDTVTYVVTIDPSTINVNVGNSVILTATVKNSKNEPVTNPQIEWKIDDVNIASVDKGVVKGIATGKTKVTATYSSNSGQKYEDSKEVTVIEGDSNTPLTDVAFSPNRLTMNINDTKQLNLVLTPANGRVDSKVFTSSNTSVVMVDNSGLVMATGAGTTTIEVNVNNGAFVKTMTVTVVDNSSPIMTYIPVYTPSPSVIPVQSIKIKNGVSQIGVGESVQLGYEISPTGATDSAVTWISYNNSIATVDANGVLTGVAVGKTKIVLVANGGTGVTDMIEVEVVNATTTVPVDVTDINLTTMNINLTVGSSETVTPIIVPDNAANKELDFIAGDSSIVQLVPSANKSSVTITALKEGTTTVTVRSSNGVEKTLNVTVTSNATQNPSSSGSSATNCNSAKSVTCRAGQYAYCGNCYTCTIGNYCDGTKKIPCSAGTGVKSGAGSQAQCGACTGNYYSTGDGKGCSKTCPRGQTVNSTHTGCIGATSSATPKPTAFSCSGLSHTACETGQAASSCDWCDNACHDTSYCAAKRK